MANLNRVRITRALCEAEGYLELELPHQALEALDRVSENPGSYRRLALYLRGMALRGLERWDEAIVPLEAAADLAPGDAGIGLALGWCYKRLGRLDLAISALDAITPDDTQRALVHYNLACYWCLAGSKERSIECLSQALHLDVSFRALIGAEHDFDMLRDDPDFIAVASGTFSRPRAS